MHLYINFCRWICFSVGRPTNFSKLEWDLTNHLSSSIHVISHAQTCLSWSHSQDNVLIYAKKMFSEFGQTLTELQQRSAVWTWGTWTEDSWKMGGGGRKKKKARLEWNYAVNFCLVYLKIKLTGVPCFLIATACTITVKHPLEADYCITTLTYFGNIWKSVSGDDSLVRISLQTDVLFWKHCINKGVQCLVHGS